MIQRVSVEHMTEYLKFASEFEKEIFHWKQTLSAMNERRSELGGEIQGLAVESLDLKDRLVILDGSFGNGTSIKSKKQKEAIKFRNIFGILALAVLAMIVVSLAVPGADFILGIFNLLFGMSLPIVFIAFAVFAVLFFYYASRAANKTDVIGKDNRRTLIQDKLEAAESILAAKQSEERALVQLQENISATLRKTQANLSELYSKNLIHQKYQNLAATVAMHQYLVSGSCIAVYGNEGIFYKYDIEEILIRQLMQAIETNRRLERIENIQHSILQELQGINNKLNDMRSSLHSIEKTNREIAQNTAISAQCDMAWREWCYRHY